MPRLRGPEPMAGWGCHLPDVQPTRPALSGEPAPVQVPRQPSPQAVLRQGRDYYGGFPDPAQVVDAGNLADFQLQERNQLLRTGAGAWRNAEDGVVSEPS